MGNYNEELYKNAVELAKPFYTPKGIDELDEVLPEINKWVNKFTEKLSVYDSDVIKAQEKVCEDFFSTHDESSFDFTEKNRFHLAAQVSNGLAPYAIFAISERGRRMGHLQDPEFLQATMGEITYIDTKYYRVPSMIEKHREMLIRDLKKEDVEENITRSLISSLVSLRDFSLQLTDGVLTTVVSKKEFGKEHPLAIKEKIFEMGCRPVKYTIFQGKKMFLTEVPILYQKDERKNSVLLVYFDSPNEKPETYYTGWRKLGSGKIATFPFSRLQERLKRN